MSFFVLMPAVAVVLALYLMVHKGEMRITMSTVREVLVLIAIALAVMHVAEQ